MEMYIKKGGVVGRWERRERAFGESYEFGGDRPMALILFDGRLNPPAHFLIWSITNYESHKNGLGDVF